MGYFQAKKDIEFIRDFTVLVEQYWTAEDEYNKDECFQLRARIGHDLPKAIHISDFYGAPVRVTSFPAPAVGGAVMKFNVLQAIVTDYSHRDIGRQEIADALNGTIGTIDYYLDRRKRKLRNPLFWITSVLTFILRIPFMLVQATGFNVDKVEDNLFGKLFKLIYLILLILFLLYIGIPKDKLLQLIPAGK